MAVDGNEVGAGEEPTRDGSAPDAAPMTVTSTLSGGTVHGPVIQAGRIGTVIVNPAPDRGGPPQAAGGGPFPLGALPSLASAFQSRDDVHGRLAAALAAEAPHGLGLRSAVLAGGGGVGKSQLAAAWAHRAAETGADLVLWVDATDVSNVLAQYARAAAALGVPGTTADPADTERDAAAFLSWLTATDGRWLLVLDDVTDFTRSAVWPTRARNPGSQVLATTRLRDATVSSAGRTIVEVGLFSRDESLAFLRSRLTGAGRPELLDESAERLAQVLGHLPLALGHAAAYTVRNGCTTGEYLDRFTARSADLDSLMPAATDAERYGRPVTAALLVALEAAQREEPEGLAVPAMQLAAVLDPAGHPRQLWTEPAVLDYLAERRSGPDRRITDPPFPPKSVLRNLWRLVAGRKEKPKPPVSATEARQVLAVLHNYNLLTDGGPDAGPRAIAVHALTSRATREVGPKYLGACFAASWSLQSLWPEYEHTDRALVDVLRANSEHLARTEHKFMWMIGADSLLFALGRSLTDAGLHVEATEYWKFLVRECEERFGPDHEDTRSALLGLASAYNIADRSTDAVALGEQLLSTTPSASSLGLSGGISVRNSLVVSYGEAGRPAEALALAEQLLADVEQLWGPTDPNTLTVRSNVASCYQNTGRVAEAVELGEAVLRERERTLGHEHEDTVHSRTLLAGYYRQVGRTDEAVGTAELAHAQSERIHGDDGLPTLSARKTLVTCYLAAGRAADAVAPAERLVDGSARRVGDTHRRTFNARALLEAVYGTVGRTADAVAVLERLLADLARTKGLDSPTTLATRQRLGKRYLYDGRPDDAVTTLEQSLAEHTRVLSADAPDTYEAQLLLAGTYWRIGRHAESMAMREALLAGAERHLGGDLTVPKVHAIDFLGGLLLAHGRALLPQTPTAARACAEKVADLLRPLEEHGTGTWSETLKAAARLETEARHRVASDGQVSAR